MKYTALKFVPLIVILGTAGAYLYGGVTQRFGIDLLLIRWARHGIIAIVLLTALLAAVWLRPRHLLGLNALGFPLLLALCITLNTHSFSKLNSREAYKLELLPDNSLFHLTQNSPCTWARQNLSVYLFIRDHLPDRDILVYSPKVFDSVSLKEIAKATRVKVSEYAHEITQGRGDQLLALPHTVVDCRPDGDFVFVLDSDPAEPDETLYVMREGRRHFVVPAHLLPKGEIR